MKSQQEMHQKKIRCCKRLFWAGLFLCLFPPHIYAETAGAVFLKRAEEYYEAGRYLEALSFYNDCVNNSDTDEQKAAALFGLGLLFDRYLNDPERALGRVYLGRNHLRGCAALRHRDPHPLLRPAPCAIRCLSSLRCRGA